MEKGVACEKVFMEVIMKSDNKELYCIAQSLLLKCTSVC